MADVTLPTPSPEDVRLSLTALEQQVQAELRNVVRPSRRSEQSLRQVLETASVLQDTTEQLAARP